MVERQKLFHHILVPVDGSQLSVAAGRLAVQLAAIHRARITFVYVVDSTVTKELTSAMGKTKQQIYVGCLAADAGLSNEKVICCGTPCSEIETLAREQGVDLIIIGQVGHRGPRRILIGSVTERVIEYAPCPVLVVK